jgi:multidrug efflux pump subunit AcrB
MFGALLFTLENAEQKILHRRLDNDAPFTSQVGLVTLVGLVSKNGILICAVCE